MRYYSEYPLYKCDFSEVGVFCVYTGDMYSICSRKQLHTHDCISILYIEKEHVVIKTVDHVFTPKAGDFIFFLPGTAHALLADNPEGYHTDIYIMEDFFYQHIFPRLSENPVFMDFFFAHMMPDKEQPLKLISTADNPYFKEKMDTIHREYLLGDYLSQSIMTSELLTLLAHLARVHHEDTKKERSRHAKADEIVRYISSHFLTVTLDELACQFHYAPNYISQSLSSETGKSLTEWLHHFRINHAKTMLCSTSIPASTIASACGFENPKYFYRVFRKITGMTPTDYRNQHNSK